MENRMAREIEQIYDGILEIESFDNEEILRVFRLFKLDIRAHTPQEAIKVSDALYKILQKYREEDMSFVDVKKNIKKMMKKTLRKQNISLN